MEHFDFALNLIQTYRTSNLETRIAIKILRGDSNSEIAGYEFLSETLVKRSVERLYNKTGVKSRAQFIVKFLSQYEAV